MERKERMARRRGRASSTSGEMSGSSAHEDSNNLHSKIENENGSADSENYKKDPTNLNLNIDEIKDEKSYNKEDVKILASETRGDGSRLRRRSNQVSYCPPRTPSPESQPSSSAKKRKLNKAGAVNKRIDHDHTDDLSRDSNTTHQSNETNSDDEDDKSNVKENIPVAIAMEKLEFDIKIDPNVVDRYTDSGFTAGGSTPESPETRRERIDIISRQCRLHPANKKYNQGPVENPPPITPGKMVGYTPAGQRHEVDLNFDRPTWFNSEYARMQWDYATRVNVSRMFHQLETGTFLPDGLDPNIERRYLAEQEMASTKAAEHFQEIANASSSLASGQSSDLSSEDNEHFKLLEAEKELIELNKYAVVRIQDFAGEINKKLRKALDLTLTPLMIKKNPAILDTLETLGTQCIHIEVVLAARALLDKIKGLFSVPENQEFGEFFAQEVNKLREKTKNMSGFDILMLTEEPPDESEDEESLPDTIPVSELDVTEEDFVQRYADQWVPVENGELWVDAASSDNESIDLESHFSEVDDVEDWTSNEDDAVDVLEDDGEISLSESSDFEADLEAQIDDLLGTLISEE